MQRYIVVRIAQAIFTLWALRPAVFLSVYLTGDPALYLTGPESTTEDYQQLKKNMGLDKPVVVMAITFFGDWLRDTLAPKLWRV